MLCCAMRCVALRRPQENCCSKFSAALQMPWAKMERERHNRDLTQEETEKRTQQAVERDARRQQRIAKARACMPACVRACARACRA